MSELDEDCGCDSKNTTGFNEDDIEKMKDSMASTKERLNDMFSTIENMNIDFSHFNKMEEEIQKISKYMYSGEFVKTMENALKRSNIDPSSLRPPTNPSFSKAKPKTPIGWVYLDENGEQKFSPVEPEDVAAMPVYGE
jgi:hypothetical protein